ncbi:DUF378 domain-containing protein [Candidatus Woesearchaeota archaeon]|nr:DUF378 domain-containing protein [Candidatus Woesearchaeota archaeon]
MAKMGTLDWIAFVLLIIGGLNWGLVGIGGWNVVDMIFGSIPILLKIVYILVGLSALYMLYVQFKK